MTQLVYRRRIAVSTLSAVVLALSAPATARAQSDGARFLNPPTLAAPRGYSHVATVPPGSTLLFISGQVPLDSTGALVGAGDLRAQTVQVFENLRRALAAGGATFRDVVKITIYMLDASQVGVVREVRADYLNVAAPPASTLAEVRRLFRDDVLVEIEAVAIVPTAPRP